MTKLSPGVLGLDIDGVVADFTGAVERWVWKEHGIEPVPILTWDWFETWPNGKAVWKDLWNRGCRKEGLLRHCRPVPGAISGIRHLESLGWSIVYVTHRHDDFAADTVAWFNLHDIEPTIVHAKDKSVVGADLYVDDKADTVRELLAGNHKAFLFAQTWNRDWQFKLPTFRNWADLRRKMEEWTRG